MLPGMLDHIRLVDTSDLQLALRLQQPWQNFMHVLQVDRLYAGEVGWLSASIKAVADARVGDTITLKKAPAAKALPGQQHPWAGPSNFRYEAASLLCHAVTSKNMMQQKPSQCMSCCPCAAS